MKGLELDNIRRLIILHGNDSELARDTGLSRMALYNIKKGRTKKINAVTAISIIRSCTRW